MLPAIAYTLATFVIAALLTCGWVLTRPIHLKDEMRSWRVLLALFAITFMGPYAYNEVLTRWHGPELDHAVKASYTELPLNGPLMYYKVKSYSGTKAKVMVVANEKLDWGGTDHPQVLISLEKSGKSWHTVSYRLLNSDRLNKETYVFPVYW
jgi:hypothetical protein